MALILLGYNRLVLGLFIGMNSLSTNPTKWSKTLTQFVGNLQTSCLSVFDHFVGVRFKGLNKDHKFEVFHRKGLHFIHLNANTHFHVKKRSCNVNTHLHVKKRSCNVNTHLHVKKWSCNVNTHLHVKKRSST